MQVTKKTQLQYRIQHILFIVLLLGCIGFAGWLSNEFNQRSDWTAGKRHSLSNDTVQLLSQLPFDVKLRSYQADDPTLSKAITEILSRYQSNKANFSYQLINPDIFIKQAKTDGIQSYGQTIIEYNGQTERINSLSEENITNALIRLHRGNKPEILFLSQHGERDILDNAGTGYSQLASKLINKGFAVSNINLIQQDISIDNSVLVMGSITKPLLDTEQQKIQHFIDNGGQFLWLQDPVPHSTQLKLSQALDISFIDGVVVDINPEVSRMLKLNHPAVIPILEYKLHPITKKMQYFTLFTTAVAISSTNLQANSQWISTDLLITSKSSWSETDNFIPGVEFNKEKDLAGPLSIGIAQQRQTKHNGKNTSQRVVIIGDTDFIANNKLGSGANLDFILNTFNWLTQDDKLISIAPKNAPDLKLNLSPAVAAIFGLGFLIALPLFLFITGAIIRVKRQKK